MVIGTIKLLRKNLNLRYLNLLTFPCAGSIIRDNFKYLNTIWKDVGDGNGL